MYKKILVSDLIVEGQQLIAALKRNRFPIAGALWSYFPEAMEWRLVIASPATDSSGPLAAYTRVQRVLASTHPAQLTLSDIVLVSPLSHDYETLRSTVSAGGQFGIGPAAAIKNLVFEDAYVYQV
jgi:hypothetical protein